MARRPVRESLRRMFWIFSIIAFVIVTISNAFSPPQASEVVTNIESITGKLRFVTSRNTQYFYLRTTISGQEVDVFVRGVSETVTQQLQQLVGNNEVTIYGRMTPGNRRPGIMPSYVFVVESLTPPINQTQCEGDGDEMDIAFVVDNSPSMLQGTPNAAQMAQGIVSLSQSKLLSSSDQLALLTFSAPLGVKVPFTSNFAEVTQAVQQLEYRLRNSDISDGIRFASDYVPAERRYELDGPLPGAVIILTNSTMTPTNQMYQAVREDYEQRNLRYFVISLGSRNNELQQFTSTGGGAYYNITDTSQVQGIVNQLFDRINQPYSGCITLEFKSNKTITRPGGTVLLQYLIHNTSRQNITGGTIEHPLPTGFLADNGSSQVSVSIDALPAGQTTEKQVQARRRKQ